MTTTAILLGVLALCGPIVAYVVGRTHGARTLWRGLLSRRAEGHAALERLAAAHGAKLELVELP